MLANLKLTWEGITKKRKTQFYFLLFLVIIVSLSEIISIGAIFPFLAALSNPEILLNNLFIKKIATFFHFDLKSEILWFFTIVFIIASVFAGLMRTLLLYTQTKWGFAIGADLSFKIYKNTLNQDYKFHLNKNSSEIISAISKKANDVVHLVYLPLLMIISSLIMLVIVFSFLILFHPAMTILCSLGFGSVYCIFILFTKKSLDRNGRVINDSTSKLIQNIQEGLGGIRDVIINNSQDFYCKEFKKVDIPLRRAHSNLIIVSAIPRFGIESLGMAIIALVAYYFSNDATNFSSLLPTIGVLAMGAQRLLPIMQRSYASWTLINGGKEVLKESLGLINKNIPNQLKSSKKMDFNNELIFKNVYFKYSKNEKWGLKNINLRIKKGQSVGVIGETGSGKSTFIDILMGLLHPDKGKLIVDSIEINRSNVIEWRKNISHVPQSIFIADLSVNQNIAVGISSEKIDYKLVNKSAKISKIDDVIQNMENRYKEIIGERGSKLSGGQKQRIGIARAVYNQAKIIVFDEATSALDLVKEKQVLDSIYENCEDITLIMIAHRISTLERCDIVYQIKDGGLFKVENLNSVTY